jgi:hypothetical protein
MQVDQALGSSQCLLMGTLANFTLSKRREILEKSSVNEILQDSFLRSPLSDKVFGLSLQKVQKEVKETLPLLDHHLLCPEAKRQLLKERTQQYPEHVKHYRASSPNWPTRTEKGEARFRKRSIRHLSLLGSMSN